MTDQSTSNGRIGNVVSSFKNSKILSKSAIFLPLELRYMTDTVVENADLTIVTILNVYSCILSICIGLIIFLSIIRFYEGSIDTDIKDYADFIFGITLFITISLLMINRIALFRRRFKLKT